jgi:hypothetical protein
MSMVSAPEILELSRNQVLKGSLNVIKYFVNAAGLGKAIQIE